MPTNLRETAVNSAVACNPLPLLRVVMESLALHQAVVAAAELGVADLLSQGPKPTSALSSELKVDQNSLYRLLRLLASQAIFAETAPGFFSNTPISNCLRSDAPVSLRATARFRGTDFVYRSYGEILHTVRTGEPARAKVLGQDGWEYLQKNPEMARIFDDAMTDLSRFVAPEIASAYDFAQWESLMDVGGGNGVLLASILRAHPNLRGVLCDQPHVLERARQRGFLAHDLEARSSMQPGDLFRDIPSGCRAYLMKSVIHDWNDEDARQILQNCRKAVPEDGALLLVELDLPQDATPALGKFVDVTMMVLTGGKERTIPQYSSLLSSAGFGLTDTVSTSRGFSVIVALPR